MKHSPIQIRGLLYYRYDGSGILFNRSADTPPSKGANEAEHWLNANGLTVTDDRGRRGLTSKGEAMVERILSVPVPIETITYTFPEETP